MKHGGQDAGLAEIARGSRLNADRIWSLAVIPGIRRVHVARYSIHNRLLADEISALAATPGHGDCSSVVHSGVADGVNGEQEAMWLLCLSPDAMQSTAGVGQQYKNP